MEFDISAKAAHALAAIGTAANPAVPALLKALESEYPMIRGRALFALGQCAYNDQEDVLVAVRKHLEDPVPAVRKDAEEALAAIEKRTRGEEGD
jgi:HEAT repeat protein